MREAMQPDRFRYPITKREREGCGDSRRGGANELWFGRRVQQPLLAVRGVRAAANRVLEDPFRGFRRRDK
jgi:hypothetical protein